MKDYKVIIKDGHVQIVEVEKFNPYHDPKDGRFTTGGAEGGGKNTIRSTPGWSVDQDLTSDAGITGEPPEPLPPEPKPSEKIKYLTERPKGRRGWDVSQYFTTSEGLKDLVASGAVAQFDANNMDEFDYSGMALRITYFTSVPGEQGQYEYNHDQQRATKAEIVTALKNLPPNLPKPKAITVTADPNPNPADPAHPDAVMVPGPGFAYDKKDRSIVFYNSKFDPADLMHVEGHMYDIDNARGHGLFSSGPEWAKAVGNGPTVNQAAEDHYLKVVSEEYDPDLVESGRYGKFAEDFAESFRMQYENPRKFLREFPARAAIIGRIVRPEDPLVKTALIRHQMANAPVLKEDPTKKTFYTLAEAEREAYLRK